MDVKPVARAAALEAGFHYRRPRTSRPRTPQPYAAHSREPATPRPYCRAVGLRSLRLRTACVLLIWTLTTFSLRPRSLKPGACPLRVPDYPDGEPWYPAI